MPRELSLRDTSHRTSNHGERSHSTDGVFGWIDRHPLSFNLQKNWSSDPRIAEWRRIRTAVLDEEESSSIAAAIGRALASPIFKKLGPDARGFLGIVAFFPQGVNEENVPWQYPTIPNAPKMLDGFCTLSLTYRKDGFIVMPEILRSHLCPKLPALSPLLSTTKECYFIRLLGDIQPGEPGFEDSRWITSEDVNVEHLLDVFTTIDSKSQAVWDACDRFMAQLYRHKPRPVTLGPKIEALPDGHPSKARCLFGLAQLFFSVGTLAERKRLLNRALELWRGQGDDLNTARALSDLSDTNQRMDLYEEGISQAKEASAIFERLGDPVQNAYCLVNLAWLLLRAEQLDAAEETASHAIKLLPEKAEQSQVYECHRALGILSRSKGKTDKAIHHFEIVLGIASSLGSTEQLFWIHSELADLFSLQGKFVNAQAHVDHTKSLAANSTYLLARASFLQAELWYIQDVFREARFEILAALDVFERLGRTNVAKRARQLLEQIDAEWLGQPVTPDELDDNGKFFMAMSPAVH